MNWPLVLNLGIVLALFGIGVAIEADGRVGAVRRSLPPRLRTGVGAVALGGPWIPYHAGVLPGRYVGVVDGSVVALALSLVLWFGLPLVAARLVETDSSPPSRSGC